jgi:hypothetical protein
MPYIWSCSITIICKCLDNNRNSTCCIPFISHLFNLSSTLFLSTSPFDRSVNIIIWNILLTSFCNSFCQRSILTWICSFSSRNRNKFRMNCKNFSSFFGSCLFLSFYNRTSSHIFKSNRILKV